MKKSSFLAMITRMKYINRWGLMRNIRTENLSEHSLEVAVIAHALGVINNSLGGNVDANRLAVMGLYHDASEIITGDMPTPVKYHDKSIKDAYKTVEANASLEILSLLPENMIPQFAFAFRKDEGDLYLWKLVKAADKLSALLKCIEEEKMGNKEFALAKKAQQKALDEMDLPEVNYFAETFLDSFNLTLDELR